MNQEINCKKEGYWKISYCNDNIAWKGNYKNGLKEGLWEFYNFNGRLRMQRMFI